MKITKLFLFAFFGLLIFAGYASAQIDRNNNNRRNNNDYIALYRLYNQTADDHLFTTDCDEVSSAENNGYRYESIAGYVASQQLRRTVPLYRLYLKDRGHFYTTDYNEVKPLTRSYENNDERLVGYVSDGRANKTVPFYRINRGKHHFYTTDNQEKNTVLRDREARDEGVAAYIWTSGSDSCNGGKDQGEYVPDDVPVIYSSEDYQGKSFVLDRDWNVDQDWDGSPYSIGSIIVPRGWTVILYTRRDFRGQSYELTNNAAFERGSTWYNRIRSIKAYRGYPPRSPR
ncbi:MAG: hypothetical protein ACR2J3_03380 [Aridibacter sp.]